MTTAMNEEVAEAKRVQVPFRVEVVTFCNRPRTDVYYDGKVTLGGRTITQPMLVDREDCALAILEMIRIYNDLLEENAAREKIYERDQRQIAALQGKIESLENSLRGYVTQAKKGRPPS